jgi:hypothetical protein
MKSLISTLVKRLRTTNNKVRELESASMVYTKDEHGRTSKVHEFLSNADTLKLCSALLLAVSRNGEKTPEGKLKVKAGWLQFYGGQIMGIQLSKVQNFTDILNEAGIVQLEKSKDLTELVVQDLERVEQYIYFCHEENTKPEDKQLPLTERGLAILAAVNDHSAIGAAPGESLAVNMEEIFQKAAAAMNQRVPFEWPAFDELVKSGFSDEVRANGAEKTATFQLQRFRKLYPLLALRHRFEKLNAEKRQA